MILSITDLRKGTIFQLEGHPYKVIEYSQKVMGRGGSIVNVRIKSLIDSKVLDKTFKGNEQLESANVSNINVQYLYEDGTNFYFMDNNDFQQYSVLSVELSSQKGYIKEGDIVQLQLFEGNPISIELPKNVVLEVTYTEDVVRGDTTTNLLKDATVETGIIVKVPAFINKGDTIRVDTRTGDYIEREK